MGELTLRYRAIPDEAEIGSVDAVVGRHNGRITWQRNAGPAYVYALVEEASEACAAELAAVASAEIVDSPLIALAVSPHAAEALPALQHALGGPGAPSGVIRCETEGDAVLVEWNMERTAAPLMMALIDVELLRFGGGRSNRLLAPLPLAWSTKIAAEGLKAPEIAPERVLEALLERHHVAD